MKKLLSFLPFVLSGCSCEAVLLPPDERAWFAPYQQAGQILTFRSNRGRTVTAEVQPRQEWHTNQDCNFMESGLTQPIFVQNVLRPSEQYSKGDPSFFVNIRKHTPDKAGYMTFELAGLSCETSSQMGETLSKLVQEPCTLASGQTYPAAYAFRRGQNCKDFNTTQLKSFFWDKQAGLIRYELMSGEVFDLVGQ